MGKKSRSALRALGEGIQTVGGGMGRIQKEDLDDSRQRARDLQQENMLRLTSQLTGERDVNLNRMQGERDISLSALKLQAGKDATNYGRSMEYVGELSDGTQLTQAQVDALSPEDRKGFIATNPLAHKRALELKTAGLVGKGSEGKLKDFEKAYLDQWNKLYEQTEKSLVVDGALTEDAQIAMKRAGLTDPIKYVDAVTDERAMRLGLMNPNAQELDYAKIQDALKVSSDPKATVLSIIDSLSLSKSDPRTIRLIDLLDKNLTSPESTGAFDIGRVGKGVRVGPVPQGALSTLR